MGGRRLRRGVFCCILIYSIRKPPTKGLTSHSWGGWSIFLLPGRSRPGLLFSQDTVGPKSLTRENSDVSTFRRTARRVWAQQQERTPPRIVLGHRTHLRSDLQAISDLEVEKSLETCGSGQGRPYTLVGAKRCQRGRCQRGDPSTSLQTAASPVSNETATVYIYIYACTQHLCATKVTKECIISTIMPPACLAASYTMTVLQWLQWLQRFSAARPSPPKRSAPDPVLKPPMCWGCFQGPTSPSGPSTAEVADVSHRPQV